VVGSALVEARGSGAFPLQSVVRLPASGKAAFEWSYDLEAALEQARRDDKLVMAYFWGNNCPACEKYQRHIWTRPETADVLRGYVPVKINVDE
jgi:thiol-disulfide isomerase/thioredoxin